MKHSQPEPTDSAVSKPHDDASMIQRELKCGAFPDERPGKRLGRLLDQFADGTAESVPFDCQDWASMKAAYRFFDNDRVTEEDILAGHFRCTRERFGGVSGTMLILHDTTQLSYRRENIGVLHKPKHGPSDCWRHENPLCGISLHSSLVITPAGLPLGLAAARFRTRKEFKGINALKRKINPTRVPIAEKESLRWLLNLQHASALLGEPAQCVHVADRESDIQELFCAHATPALISCSAPAPIAGRIPVVARPEWRPKCPRCASKARTGSKFTTGPATSSR